jgi:C4-dicarboxylate-specific signal transduction histidine kinase
MEPSGDNKKKRILVVDDEEVNRTIIATMLEAEGHEAIQAVSGKKALEIVGGGDIDLVLLDIVMPGLNGFETCIRMRNEMNLINLPIVFITSLDDRESRIYGKEVGADDFLNKPVDTTELKVRVQNLLKVKAYHDLQDHLQAELEKELERTRDQLIRADRLATLGTLATGVGHEMSNAAGILNSAVYYIRKKADSGEPPEQQDLDNLESVAKHFQTHAKQLLAMGRPGPELVERLDLCSVLKGAMEMLRIAGKTKYMDVALNLPEGEAPVEVNRTRIEQVIINLVGNAVDAIQSTARKDGKITVTIGERSSEGRIVCKVEDTGPGIDKDRLETVFEPFFTTKKPGQGTGLGLSVIRNIVDSYKGKITARNAEEGGAVFEFNLPVA